MLLLRPQNGSLVVFLTVLFAILIIGKLVDVSTIAQSSKDFDQQNKEKFLELGEEEFRKDCYKNRLDVAESVLDDICEFMIDKIKNETGTLQQNQTLESTTEPIGYKLHSDTTNGFSVEYPSDWHVGDYGNKIFKGTREFKITAYDNPKVSVLDTYNFGNIIFDSEKEHEGVKITGDIGKLNLDGEPALTFTYSELNKELMVVAIMHDNIGYVFEYSTLKDNFVKDFDTMMHFFGTIRFA